MKKLHVFRKLHRTIIFVSKNFSFKRCIKNHFKKIL